MGPSGRPWQVRFFEYEVADKNVSHRMTEQMMKYPKKWRNSKYGEYYMESLKYMYEHPEEMKAAMERARERQRRAARLVLLFETRGGWNQFGTGKEMLCFENHKGKGAHVMLANGQVKFVTPEEAGKLEWRLEESVR